MIPRDYINEWRDQAPWISDFQVEQDLVITRALINIFSDQLLAGALAFRGGTALYKLYLKPAARYSEDIDLVQVRSEPAGVLMGRLRNVLEPWLGKAVWKQTKDRVTFSFRFASEESVVVNLRLKVEINTREHFAILGFKKQPYFVNSRWFSGTTAITTYTLDELLATKLRALYQRKKGRDLFDLVTGLNVEQSDADRIVETFRQYMRRERKVITRAMFEQNLNGKLQNSQFLADMSALIRPNIEWQPQNAALRVMDCLISRLPGDPWKSADI